VLPSLDRLAGLIERVVELVDEVSGGPVAAPQPKAEPPPALPAPPVSQPQAQPQPQAQSRAAEVAASDGAWLAFVGSPHGYALVELRGAPPAPGNELEINGARYRVVRHSPSPLPGDGRRCAVVEMEEPPEPERTSDG
jgi:hypothetical protein